MSSLIHETALVHPEAQIAQDVKIGAYSIIDKDVEIDEGTEIQSHVVLRGRVKVGKGNTLFPFCSIGAEPQDMTYSGEPTEVHIGDNNVLREYVSIHRGTMKDRKVTTIGNHCMLMAHVHIGHDALIGDHCIMANSVNLAGHVKIGERTIIGGGTNISQFVGIGRGAYLGGASAVDRDVPPLCTGYGNRIRLKGVNIVGMRRQGVEKPLISEIVDFYRAMEASPLSPRAFVDETETMEEYKSNRIVQEMTEFIRQSKVGVAPFMS